MDTPFISVVVPTRNRAALLRDCLESLLAQDFPNRPYEILVIDDGSIDGTASVVASMREGPKRAAVRYIRSPGTGPNTARNEGVRIASGDLIVFVDDDVEAPPSWLRELVDGSMRHPRAGCLGGPIRLRLEASGPRLCGREPLGETELDLGDHDQAVEAVWSANMAVRRSAFEQVGLFCDALLPGGDEVEWEFRFRARGGTIAYVPRAWLWHRRPRESLKIWRLVRTRFQRGRNQVLFAKAVGLRMRLVTELSAIPRYLAHAARRRCAWGLLAASRSAGRAWGLVSYRMSKLTQRTGPAALPSGL